MYNCIDYFIIYFGQVVNYSGVFFLVKIFEWKRKSNWICQVRVPANVCQGTPIILAQEGQM